MQMCCLEEIFEEDVGDPTVPEKISESSVAALIVRLLNYFGC